MNGKNIWETMGKRFGGGAWERSSLRTDSEMAAKSSCMGKREAASGRVYSFKQLESRYLGHSPWQKLKKKKPKHSCVIQRELKNTNIWEWSNTQREQTVIYES